MRRSKWKGPYLEKKNVGQKFIMKRYSEIMPSFVGKTFWVHNGQKLVKVAVNDPTRVGHKIGEFVPTRCDFVFKKKKKKK